MAIKKNIVHVSCHTFVDVEVYADESVSYDEVMEIGRKKAARNDENTLSELLGNMVEDGNTEVVTFRKDIFENKEDVYAKLLEKVVDSGFYILIDEDKRPTFKLTFTDCDGRCFTKEVKVKSIINTADASSPLSIIDEDDKRYDLDDYLATDDVIKLYAIVMGWVDGHDCVL